MNIFHFKIKTDFTNKTYFYFIQNYAVCIEPHLECLDELTCYYIIIGTYI
jgi:hypothetical protein